MKYFRLFLAVPFLVGVAGLARATTTMPTINIRVDHGSVWSASGKQASTEGFLQIHNDGTTDDTLTAWACPNADSTVLMGQDGKPVNELLIPAGKTVTLMPGGMFLALKGLKYPVLRGSIMPCAFTFSLAGEVGGFLNEVRRPKE